MLAAALALLAPAVASGQSAGDEQYQDPFAGENQPQQESPAPTGGDGDSAPAPAAAPPASTPTTGTAPVEPTATTAGTLPRTGPAAGWIAGAGVLALMAGAGLRRSART